MTTKDLIKAHNDLAAQLGLPALNGWKASKEALQARIDGLTPQVTTDPLAIPDEAAEPLGAAPADQVLAEAAEETGGADQAPVEASGPVVESAEAPAMSGKGIGKLVASLLLDAEGFDYPTIVAMVTGEFPDAQTSTRSVASVAAAQRGGHKVPGAGPRD